MEFIGTPIKGQATQRVQSTSSLSSSPAATASRSTIVSVPQEGPSLSVLPHSTPGVLPHSTPSVEIELPAPNSVEKPAPALSSKANPVLTGVALVLGDLLEKEQIEPQGAGAKGTKGAGATRVHPKATVTSEENEEDEVDDEKDEEEEEKQDQEEKEDGEGAEKWGEWRKQVVQRRVPTRRLPLSANQQLQVIGLGRGRKPLKVPKRGLGNLTELQSMHMELSMQERGRRPQLLTGYRRHPTPVLGRHKAQSEGLGLYELCSLYFFSHNEV